MTTLVLSPRITPDTEAIAATAHAAGWDVQRLTSWRVPADLLQSAPVLYGEPLFADVVAAALGVALLQPSGDWLPNLPWRYRLRTVQTMTLATARHWDQPAFIKPADDKCFSAQVYRHGAELPDASILSDDTAVLISDIVHWQVEYRCFVLERRVMTCSPYWRDGRLAQAADGTWPALLGEREAALEIATMLLADPAVETPAAFVLDVGRIAGQGWAVIEANSAWGSGLYGCDPAAVLPVLARSVLPQTPITPTDQRWLRVLPAIEAEQSAPPPVADTAGLVTLYRPVGAAELALIAARGYRAFPARLPEQPIFYPVTNARYAREIAERWNTQDAASSYCGVVTCFRVSATALASYPVQTVGASYHQEYWIPAEELERFNAAIIGAIEVIVTYPEEANDDQHGRAA